MSKNLVKKYGKETLAMDPEETKEWWNDIDQCTPERENDPKSSRKRLPIPCDD